MSPWNTKNPDVSIRHYHSVIVGSGAAGMNCAVHLWEFMRAAGIEKPQEHIAVVTRGLPLGASRMSGSDKQTYYKLGTAADTPDSAAHFAQSLSAAGCAHEDLALIEGATSLREFHHLVRAGVPFPCDSLGAFVGYKTDHDPYERATSAGPKTSRMMSECLEREARAYGISIFDRQEVVALVRDDEDKIQDSNKQEGVSKPHKGCLGHSAAVAQTSEIPGPRYARSRAPNIVGPDLKRPRIKAVVCLDTAELKQGRLCLNVFQCDNLILAAGGPGALYETTVYPQGQIGLHGLAFEAGLAAENLTESQFGLASIKFRWNVSGTYMQAIPRIFSTDREGNDPREFLADSFPTMSKLATAVFLKGYQWPFDPQRVTDHQSSLIDLLVSQETSRGRRVFLDYRANPTGNETLGPFSLEDLEEEALGYLKANDALQRLPIERLAHMNPLAIDLYAEHGIDLHREPLEIAVCAQHNNGGFAVNRWWESSIPHTFVIGEMAGTHGVKRPGGSALNAGQVGGLRAAEYIVKAYGVQSSSTSDDPKAVDRCLDRLTKKWDRWFKSTTARRPEDVLHEIQQRMTLAAGHLRNLSTTQAALAEACTLIEEIHASGLQVDGPAQLVEATEVEHLAVASVAFLKAIVVYLEQAGGSRGSFLVLDNEGQGIHPNVCDVSREEPMRFQPENRALRQSILRVEADDDSPDGFRCEAIPIRRIVELSKAFEAAWRDFRRGKIYEET